MYQVLSSSSLGNCVIYHNCIAIDMGVPYKLIKAHQNSLQIVLLTHQHGDHFNVSTIKKLAFERPTLRFACGEFLKEHLGDIKNIDVMVSGEIYDYGEFQISPITLYHDVPNFGFRIFKDGIKIIHATDTSHLEGISAKDYDLYAIESNYDEDTVFEKIKVKQIEGEYAYEVGAIKTHLSEQQARDFIYRNRGNKSKVLRLHESLSI